MALVERQPPKTLDEHVSIVRRKLQDYAEKNELSEKIDFEDQDYADFVMDALEEINDMTPKTTFNIADFPRPSLLYKGGMVHALIAAGVIEFRNQLNFNDNGISFNKRDKGPAYIQIAQNWQNDYLQRLLEFKRGMALGNMRMIGISSEFEYRGRYRYR